MFDRVHPVSGGAEIGSRLECIEVPAIVLDSDYRILGANRRYCREFSRRRTSVIGRRCYEVAHARLTPCERYGETCPLRTSCRTGQPARSLHVHHGRHGSLQREITVFPVPRDDDRPAAFLEILRDYSQADWPPDCDRLAGDSAAFHAMLELVESVAETETPVLLFGEPGTGKGQVAWAVHAQSARRDGPFVPVHCSGLHESRFEGELFGHERGASESPYARRRGLVDAAAGGTLFLDEVGDAPPPMQARLLRLVETGAFRRVGGANAVRASFRLVCATRRDLGAMVGNGEFRTDLYFRISSFPIRVPPLREREGDVAVLARWLLRRIDPGRTRELAPETVAMLERYPFPGNIRELRHVLERACVRADGDTILPSHLPGRDVPRSAS